MIKLIEDYIKSLHQISGEDIKGMLQLINKDKRIFIMGNGGSAATGNHFANDLQAIGMRATSLCANIAILTRLSNDYSYSEVFSAYLREEYLQAWETVIAISGSGNSSNILKAIEYAKEQGAVTLALIGFGGGKLKALADYSIILSSQDYGEVEGVHSCLCHIIPHLIKKEAEEWKTSA